MSKRFFVFFLLISNVVFAAGENSQAQKWNSPEGLKRLERSQFKNDFYQLVNFYQPQENPLFCSIATGTMIRNALDYGDISSQKEGEVVKSDGTIAEYHLYTQKGFFNQATEKVKKRAIVENKETLPDRKTYDAGLSLGDFAKMLSIHGLGAWPSFAQKNDVKFGEEFREVLKRILAEREEFVVVNFDGKVLGKETRGHISPLAAYDEETDSVLVLDVALHKNPWYWIEVSELLKAMNTKDGNTYRGYLMVSRFMRCGTRSPTPEEMMEAEKVLQKASRMEEMKKN